MDIYSKYTRFALLKDEKSITITNAFRKDLDKSNQKPNTIWGNRGDDFYNILMK